MIKLICRVVIALALVAAALPGVEAKPRGAKKPKLFTLTSTSFAEGGAFATRFTCDGIDESPALVWTAPPTGTRGLALVVDDPDAPGGTFTHWLVWNLPVGEFAFPEGVNRHKEGTGEIPQGTNDFGRHGWAGPCPPAGKLHHYVFRLLALDAPLALAEGADRKAFDAALAKVKVLETITLTGTYQR